MHRVVSQINRKGKLMRFLNKLAPRPFAFALPPKKATPSAASARLVWSNPQMPFQQPRNSAYAVGRSNRLALKFAAIVVEGSAEQAPDAPYGAKRQPRLSRLLTKG